MAKRKVGVPKAQGSVRVFVSWSGPASKVVAETFRTWLPSVIQTLDVFVSSNDIEKGVRWRAEIDAQIAGSHFGIACLTPENVGAPAKAVGNGDPEPPLFTYLIGLRHADIRGPLAEFQHTVATKDDTRTLLHSLNKTVGRVTGRELPKETVDSLFDVFWPKLDEAIAKARGSAPPREVRSTDNILGELLDLVRSIDQRLAPRALPATPDQLADTNATLFRRAVRGLLQREEELAPIRAAAGRFEDEVALHMRELEDLKSGTLAAARAEALRRRAKHKKE